MQPQHIHQAATSHDTLAYRSETSSGVITLIDQGEQAQELGPRLNSLYLLGLLAFSCTMLLYKLS